MQDHKTSTDICERTKIAQMFSDQNKIKFKSVTKKIWKKNTKYKTKHATRKLINQRRNDKLY